MLLKKTAADFVNGDAQHLKKNRSRRYSPSVSLKVFNRETGERIGRIGNISLTGLMLQTSRCLQVNSTHPFALILPAPIKGARTVAFDACCVWSNFDASQRVYLSGFALDPLTDQNQDIIQVLINSYSS